MPNSQFLFDFNSIADNTAIATSQSSPDAPFSAVNPAGQTSWKASTTSPFEGAASGVLTCAASSTTAVGLINFGNGAGTSRLAWSMVMNLSAYPTVGANGWSLFAMGGISLRITSAGKLLIYNTATSAQVRTSTTTLSTGSWYRIEFAYTGNSSTSARAELNIWDATGGSLLESYDSGATLSGALLSTFDTLFDNNAVTSSTAWTLSHDLIAADITLPVGSFPPYANGFEGQADGTTISTANSGGTSAGVVGQSGAAFSSVTTFGSGTASYSATVSFKASKCLALSYTSFASGAYVKYNLVANSPAGRQAIRAYVNLGTPAGNVGEDLLGLNDTTGLSMGLTSAGLFVVRANSTDVATSSVTASTGTWYRVELAALPGTTTTTGVGDYAVYAGDSATALWSGSLTGLNLGTTGKVSSVYFGRQRSSSQQSARTAYYDDVAVLPMTSGLIGPSATPPLATTGAVSSNAQLSATGVAIEGPGKVNSNAQLAAVAWNPLGSTLPSTASMVPNDTLWSSNGAFYFKVLTTGLAEYDSSNNLVWSSSFSITSAIQKLTMEASGQLRVSDTFFNSTDYLVPSSGAVAGSYLQIAPDGNVAIWKPDGSATTWDNGFHFRPAFTGAGALTTAATLAVARSPGLTGVGALATTAAPSELTAPALAGSGALAVSGGASFSTTGSVSADVQVSGSATDIRVTTGSISAAAQASATASMSLLVSPTFSGSGTLTNLTAVNPQSGPGLSGTGGLSIAGLTMLSTTGAVTAAVIVGADAVQPITLIATGEVNVNAQIRASATSYPVAEVTGSVSANVAPLEAIEAAGELTATAAVVSGSSSTGGSGSTDGSSVTVDYSNLSVSPDAVLGQSSTLTLDSLGLVSRTLLPMDSGITVRILTPAPDLQLIDMVPTFISASVLEGVKDDGAGSFKVQVDDPRFSETPELANYLNVAQIAVDGVIRGAFILKNVHRQLVGDGENAQVVFEFSGPGLREWLRHAVIYPQNQNNLALESLQPGTRYFNFGSPLGNWYDDAQWSYPTRMVQVRDTSGTIAITGTVGGSTGGIISSNPWGTSPVGWPDVQGQQVFWVWDRDARSSAPVGDVYFRRMFNSTDTKATYTLFVTADNAFQAYIDGVPISAQNLKESWHFLWEGSIDLGPGLHTLAIKASNGSPTSPAGMACLLYKNGSTADSIANGDTNTNPVAQLVAWSGDPYWRCLGYPARPPGFTAGEVLHQLINEAKARGVASMQRLQMSFTPSADSNGEAWIEPIDWAFDIGMTYYEAVQRLEELACEISIDPATFTLNAYNKQGTDRSVQTASTQPVMFVRGHNVVTATEDSQVNFVNSFLVSYGDNKVMEVLDTFNQIPVVGRIEGYASTDASYSTGTATWVANKMLELGKDPLDSATIVITDVEDHTPWKDFRVGDWVQGPGAGGTRKRRVVSIAASNDAKTGRTTYEVELDSRSQDLADRIAQYLARVPSFAALGTSVAAGSSGGVTDTGGGTIIDGGGDTGGGTVDPGGGGGGVPSDGGPIGFPPPPPITDPGSLGLAVYVQPDDPKDYRLGVFWYDTDG